MRPAKASLPPFLRYGKYCGLLYGGCPGEKPCDGLDSCCMQHDACIAAKNMANQWPPHIFATARTTFTPVVTGITLGRLGTPKVEPQYFRNNAWLATATNHKRGLVE
ncbi:hypothetical protein LguiA_025567 [Lonicera macranthoides]